MKKKIISLKNKIFYFTALLFTTIPFNLIYADEGGVTTPDSFTINNPLKVGSIEDLFSSILSIVMILTVPIIIFFIIYSGFIYATAKGNPGEIERATKSLTYAIIGGVLVLGATAISEIVKNLVSSF